MKRAFFAVFGFLAVWVGLFEANVAAMGSLHQIETVGLSLLAAMLVCGGITALLWANER